MQCSETGSAVSARDSGYVNTRQCLGKTDSADTRR